jgi:hypothetical protein
MSAPNRLPGPENHGETTDPRTEGITPGDSPEARRGRSGATGGSLPPVWRGPDGHDEWCESCWDEAVKKWHPCGCVYRVLTGAYPDGQRSPE